MIEDITDDEIEKMLTTNLISPIRLIRGFVGQMKERKFGRIVNIGSVWAVVSKPGRGVYSASKNGLHGITNTLAQIESLAKEIPLGRLAAPEEIADLVYFFGSGQNTYLTAQKIIADGGFTAR